MKKQEIKSILMSMRTQENRTQIDNWLGKIDTMDQCALKKIDINEEHIRDFFESKLIEKSQNQSEEKFPINDMFTYGVSENCIHLHLPVDLHGMLAEKGISTTIDIVNMQLLDAIDKINDLKNNGFYRFQGKNSIFMISPILMGKEIKFLQSMDFKTQLYKKGDLKDEGFVKENSNAKLAVRIFGRDKNVGTAIISFETINSKEWQDKEKQKIQELTKKGIRLKEDALVK